MKLNDKVNFYDSSNLLHRNLFYFYALRTKLLEWPTVTAVKVVTDQRIAPFSEPENTLSN
jgi:hypothetical protein